MNTDLTFFTNETVEIIQILSGETDTQISQPLTDQLLGEIIQPPLEELNIGKQQTLSVEFKTPSQLLFAHFL